MKKTIRLTESELKNVIIESIKNILNEGINDEPSNTHYAIHKPTGKIVFSWDYNGYDAYELGKYRKDYFVNDLVDMGMNPKEMAVWTRRTCMAQGIDPTDDRNWSNYPMSESIIKEIGDTPKGQRALGGLTARKKYLKERILKEFNRVLPYGNSISREQVKGLFKLNANALLDYLPINNECGPICDEVKEIIEMVLDGCIIEFEGISYYEEATNSSDVEGVTLDNSSVEFCISKIDSFDEVSDEAKAYAKELLNNVVNDIDLTDIDWE